MNPSAPGASPGPAPHSRTSSLFKGLGFLVGEALRHATEKADERAALAEYQRRSAAVTEEVRLQAERLEAQSIATARTSQSGDSSRFTNTTDRPSEEEAAEMAATLLRMLDPATYRATSTPSPSPRLDSTTSGTERTSTPAGWRSYSFPMIGVTASLPANHTIVAGVSGPANRVLTVPSGRANVPFHISLNVIYSHDGINEHRARQSQTWVNNGGMTLTLMSGAQPLALSSPGITATSSCHRGENLNTIYSVILGSNAHNNGVYLCGNSPGADANALRAMVNTIARSIRFLSFETTNVASHALVGSYTKSGSESSTSNYARVSRHETISLYLFSDGFYLLSIFTKTFGFAAGISGISTSDTKNESGFWDTKGSNQRGTVTLRELGDHQEAGVELGVRECQYETGSYGVIIHLGNTMLQRRRVLRLRDFHSL
ncbi:hypothetical protein CLCR_02459 [Cladophialophora carrionii]|uniref:Uncharacterized protein n=1 Tax=Cladophialophora carrionii TaxID=86049 RepID=A0A1C1CEY4_9EURO|nr:hypothetical protein CLCR_02459 [Cladophialophora carrionii]